MEQEQADRWFEAPPPAELERCASSRKFSDDEVCQMRHARANGWGYREIAEKFNASAPAVWSAVVGETYRHIQDPPPAPRQNLDRKPRGSMRQPRSK